MSSVTSQPADNDIAGVPAALATVLQLENEERSAAWAAWVEKYRCVHVHEKLIVIVRHSVLVVVVQVQIVPAPFCMGCTLYQVFVVGVCMCMQLCMGCELCT